eukprot:6197845-Pleurochrysis_carterae.AAC.2
MKAKSDDRRILMRVGPWLRAAAVGGAQQQQDVVQRADRPVARRALSSVDVADVQVDSMLICWFVYGSSGGSCRIMG